MKVTYNAGATWNPLLAALWPDGYRSAQKQDIIVETSKGFLPWTIGIECKGTDLHSSLFKTGTETKLTTELRTKYFGRFDEVWILVGNGNAVSRDIQTTLSIAWKHRSWNCWVKWWDTQANAVRSLAKMLDEPTPDLRMPEYVNESDAPTVLWRMLRQFPGLSETKISAFMATLEDRMLVEPVSIISQYLPLWLQARHSDLYRLWRDWYHSGTEPANNRLRVKKTRRKDLG